MRPCSVCLCDGPARLRCWWPICVFISITGFCHCYGSHSWQIDLRETGRVHVLGYWMQTPRAENIFSNEKHLLRNLSEVESKTLGCAVCHLAHWLERMLCTLLAKQMSFLL
jgi:hypothetical protein